MHDSCLHVHTYKHTLSAVVKVIGVGKPCNILKTHNILCLSLVDHSKCQDLYNAEIATMALSENTGQIECV